MRRITLPAALVALTLLLATRGIGTDVYEGGEAREALVAREMVETGDWILPLWNGTMMPSKPPLFHWLVASGAVLTRAGVTEWTLRLPSVLLAGAAVFMVFSAGAAWGGQEVGMLAALVLATTPQFLREAGHGRVDMTLLAAVVAAELLLVDLFRRGSASRARQIALAACLGLAMLAKGPVGPGLVALTALALAARERNLRLPLGLVRPVTVLVFLGIAGTWYGLAYLHRGADFVAKQIVSENGEALLGGSRFPHRSPLYYVGPLLLGGLPWTLLLPWAAVRAWRGDIPRRAALLWAVVVLAFFSLAPLKRAAYLLPLRPALALVIGWWIAEQSAADQRSGRLVDGARALLLVAAGSAVACLLTAEAVVRGRLPTAALREAALRREVDLDAYARAIASARWEILIVAATGAVAALLAVRALGRGRWRRAAVATTGAAACAAFLVGDVFVPGRVAQKSVRPFADAVRVRVPPADPLVLLTAENDADAGLPLIFYLRRHVPVRAAPKHRPPEVPPGHYVLDQPRWDAWRNPNGWKELLRSPHRFSSHRPDPVLVRRE